MISHHNLIGSMCPWWNLPDERLLDGDSLLFGDEVDNLVVKDLLFNYITPRNARIDLMSSLFGRDGDEEISEASNKDNEVINDQDGEHHRSFDVAKAGPPMIEPRFGTKFWTESISNDTIQQWSDSAKPQIPSPDLMLDLPPQNPFIPTNLDLKPLPGTIMSQNTFIGNVTSYRYLNLVCSSLDDDAAHPLLNCSVKVCITVGKKKSWFPAVATQYKIQKNKSTGVHRVLLSYEDEDEKWHVLDSPNDKAFADDALLEPGHEGSLGKPTASRLMFAFAIL